MATAARKTNWFAIWTSVIVAVIVIGVGASVVIANNMANPTYDLAAEFNEETGAVSVGEGSDEVVTYVDFMCPACNSFEKQFSNQMLKLADEDKIKLTYLPVNSLDGFSKGTNYSTRAANAFYCVAKADPKKAVEYADTLYKNQPAEQTEGLDNAKLVDLAKGLGVDIATCQEEQTYAALPATNAANLPANPASGSAVTPTVVINGEYTTLDTIYATRTYFTDRFGSK